MPPSRSHYSHVRVVRLILDYEEGTVKGGTVWPFDSSLLLRHAIATLLPGALSAGTADGAAAADAGAGGPQERGVALAAA